MGGHTLVELLAVMSVLLVLFAAIVPTLTRAADEARTRAAAFRMSARITLLRTKAVHRTANVALRFEQTGADWQFREYADGDWDGVLSADIKAGRDYPLTEPEMLRERFPGVSFGFVTGCPLVDGSGIPPGSGPVRFGTARMISFSPAGTATSGTLYLKGRGAYGYAVVVLGATGRTRILRCAPWIGRWTVDAR